MTVRNEVYLKLSKVDVSEFVEKTLQKHNYVSWVEALRLMLADYGYNFWWHVHENDDGLPFFVTPWGGAMVKVTTYITDGGKTEERSQWHPVITHTNKPITNPDTMAINTAIQRCLVKSIALHGLGLYIYAGEDLPPTIENPDREDHGSQPNPATKGQEPKKTVNTTAANNRQGEINRWFQAAIKKGLTVDDTQMILEAVCMSEDCTSASLHDESLVSREKLTRILNAFGSSVKESLEGKG